MNRFETQKNPMAVYTGPAGQESDGPLHNWEAEATNKGTTDRLAAQAIGDVYSSNGRREMSPAEIARVTKPINLNPLGRHAKRD